MLLQEEWLMDWQLFMVCFCFPFSDPDRLPCWVRAISGQTADGKVWTPSRTSRICSHHFVADDQETDKLRKFLLSTTVMSVFPTYLAHKQPKKKIIRKPPKRQFFSDKNEERPDSASTSKQGNFRDHTYYSTYIGDDLEKTKIELEISKKRKIKM